MTYGGRENTAKTCVNCRRSLPLDRYWKRATSADGRRNECKDCESARTTAYHRAHRAELRGRNNAVITTRRREQPIKAFMAALRHRAAKCRRECTISETDLHFPECCPVLGIPLSFGLGRGEGRTLAILDHRYSVDRIDNSRGYVPGNVVVVSFRANRLKSDANAAELMAVARFYERLEAEQAGASDMPAVQPHPKEETRQVPERIGDGQ